MTRLGRFALLERVGIGGMGVVWRAADDAGRLVALKTLHVESAETRRALLREIAGLARLRHPGIAALVDHGEHEGQPWYAMSWVEGAPLQVEGSPAVTLAMDDTWDPSLPEAGDVGVDLELLLTELHRLCQTLAWLHGEGIVHRDLKPDNVLVRPDGWPVLIDFGLSGRFAGGRTREAVLDGIVRAGTAGWMAPEQRLGGLVDARADLYSVGCLLYLALTGSVPPEASRAAPRPSDVVPDVAPPLDDLVTRLLAPRPEDRPGHAEDVAAVLASLGADDTPWPGAPQPRPYVYRPRVAGRAAELAAIDEVIGAGSGLLLFEGGGGTGRSRLVLEAASRAWAARQRPLLVAAGGPHLLAATGELLERVDVDVDGLDPVLGRLFPVLASRLGQVEGETPADRVGNAVLSLLFAIAADRPLLLAVDDLDAADELTVAIARRILAEAPPRLAVVATARDASRLPIDLAVRARKLPDLTGPDISAMVGDMLAETVDAPAGAEQLAAFTGGRPLLVVEAFRTGVQLGLIARRQGRWRLTRPLAELLPHDERDLVTSLYLRRVGELAPSARDVLEVAAVAGQQVEPELLRELVTDTALDAHLAELVRDGLLDGDSSGIRFVHARLREAVAGAAPPERRRALSDRIADWLLARGLVDPRLAEHLVEAGRPEQAREVWLEIARAAERRGLSVAAAEAYRAAAALAGEDAVEILRRLVHAEIHRGRYPEAIAAAKDALARAGASAVAVELLQAQAFALAQTDREQGLRVAREAVRVARLRDEGLTGALATLGYVAWSANLLTEARAALDEAVALETDAERLPGILLNLSGLLAFEGRRSEAIACLERALAQSPSTHHLGPLYGNLASMWTWAGDLQAARGALAKAIRAYRAVGDLPGLLQSDCSLARLELLAGRGENARAILDVALAAARTAALPDAIAMLLVLVAEVSMALGDLERAGAALREVLGGSRSPAPAAWVAEARRQRLLGDPAAARRALEAAGPTERMLGDDRSVAAIEAVHLARAEGRDAREALEGLARILDRLSEPIHPNSVVGQALATLQPGDLAVVRSRRR